MCGSVFTGSSSAAGKAPNGGNGDGALRKYKYIMNETDLKESQTIIPMRVLRIDVQ